MRDKKASSPTGKWHYQPDVPIAVSPILDWPPRPLAWLRWLAGYWLAISSVVLEFFLAWAVFAWLQPASETMQTLAFGWIAQIWLRNLALLTLVAGGLHLWFYGLSAQAKRLKFDARDLARDSATFTFRDQVKDNLFWSLASGVTIWTGFEALYWWAAANGYAPGLVFSESPVWFALWFVLIPIWSSFHFYWIHRALHWPPLYRMVHSLHHRNVNIGPWSGISMHPVEHLLYFSSVLIHFVVPSHPAHVLFHFYLDGLNPAFSHSGYESLLARDKKLLKSGDFFHQLHHRFFKCNFGTAELPWDRVFGSFHDGTEEASRAMRARVKQRAAG